MFSHDHRRSEFALFTILDGCIRQLTDAVDGLRRQVDDKVRGLQRPALAEVEGSVHREPAAAGSDPPQGRVIDRIREKGLAPASAFSAATVEVTTGVTTQPSRLRVKWDRPIARATLLGANVMGTAASSRADPSVVQVDLVSPPFSPTLSIRLRVVAQGEPQLVSIERLF